MHALNGILNAYNNGNDKDNCIVLLYWPREFLFPRWVTAMAGYIYSYDTYAVRIGRTNH